MQILKKSPC